MIVLKQILVATDFGESAAVALAYGRDLARTFNARLHVLHAVEDVMLRYSPEVGLASPDLQKNIEAASTRDLEKLITEDDRNTLTVVPVVKTGVNIPAEIVEYAKANQIDLIITGTHGRGAVKHFLMGSVAERVVRTAACPVLTVHAKERDFIAPDAMVAAAKA
jgi:nucleotide-binding universal stress UspA family protein